MPTPVQVAERYAAALVAANIRASIDPRDINPPCVIFSPGMITFDLNCGGTADITATLIVPGPGHADAWRQLDDLLRRVRSVLPAELAAATEWESASNTMPAYEITWREPVDFT